MAGSDDMTDFESLRVAIKDLRHRLDSVEDKVMMERLEDLAIEDEIAIIEDLIGESGEDLKEKIALLEELAEKYAEQRFDEKLRYLYAKMKEIEQGQQTGQADAWKSEIDELQKQITDLSAQVSSLHSGKEGRDLDDVYEKLYILRDKVKEVQEQDGAGKDLVQVRKKMQGDLEDRIASLEKEVERRLQQAERSGGAEDIEDRLSDQISSLEQELERRLADVEQQEAGDIDGRLESLEERIEERITGRHNELSEEFRRKLSKMDKQLREYFEALEEGLGEQAEDIEELREAGTIPDDVEERLDELQQRTEENREAIDYELEKHEEDIEKLKEVLRSPPEYADEEEYQVLRGTMQELEQRVAGLKESLKADAVTEEAVQETLASLDDWEQVQDTIADLQEDIEAHAERLEDRIAQLEPEIQGGVVEVDTRLKDVESTVESVTSTVSSVQNDVTNLRETVASLEGSVATDVSIDELLESMEYTEEEVEDRLNAVQERMEQLRADLDTQENRLEDVTGSHDFVEEKIDDVLRDQQRLNEELQKEDERLNRRMDMLLEAIEEGLSIQQRGMDRGMSGVEEALAEVMDIEEEKIERLQHSIGHVEAAEVQGMEGEHAPIRALAEMVIDSQRRLQQVDERLDGLVERLEESHGLPPTIIE